MTSLTIDEARWFTENVAALERAYLVSTNPVQQSGLNGDAAHWVRRRSVIVAALDRDGTFLDIGGANGLLMETLTTWAAERGVRVEPHGLDGSSWLAALARARLPAWSSRIHVGNAIAWVPPQRFDFVRTELVYVPEHRLHDLVAHLLTDVVLPTGRLVVCAYRPRGQRDAEPVGDEMRGWGLHVSGEACAIEPEDGGIATRVVWIDGPDR